MTHDHFFPIIIAASLIVISTTAVHGVISSPLPSVIPTVNFGTT